MQHLSERQLALALCLGVKCRRYVTPERLSELITKAKDRTAPFTGQARPHDRLLMVPPVEQHA